MSPEPGSISLRTFSNTDLPAYQSWRQEIDAEQYMSRFYPRAFDEKVVENHDLYVWYVIVADGVAVGTVWLEKDEPQDRVANLGILIGKTDHLGVGIGRRAIPMAIRQAQQRLDFEAVRLSVRRTNTRAIASYKGCGFTIVREGRKVNPQGQTIVFYDMHLSLTHNSP